MTGGTLDVSVKKGKRRDQGGGRKRVAVEAGRIERVAQMFPLDADRVIVCQVGADQRRAGYGLAARLPSVAVHRNRTVVAGEAGHRNATRLLHGALQRGAAVEREGRCADVVIPQRTIEQGGIGIVRRMARQTDLPFRIPAQTGEVVSRALNLT